MTSNSEQLLLTVRPRRIAIYAGIAAFLVVGVSVVVGVLLRDSDRGVTFRVSDQIGVMGVGFLIAAAILLAARPRLRVYRSGIRVRNVLGERYFPWALVQRIAFPEGSNWAQVQLPDDEAHPLMAIQALDRQRAVAALRQVRDLHGQFAPPAPEPSVPPPAPEPAGDYLQQERPLGRLERIDLEKAGLLERRRR